MEYQDYYKTLGVSRSASNKDIKKAYRQLARKYHPDLQPDDKSAEQKLKTINEAYDVLGNPEKRAKYDRLGASWYHHQARGGRSGGFDWSNWASQGQPGHGSFNYGDMFGQGMPQGGFSDFFNTISICIIDNVFCNSVCENLPEVRITSGSKSLLNSLFNEC